MDKRNVLIGNSVSNLKFRFIYLFLVKTKNHWLEMAVLMSPLLDNQPATYVKQIRKKLLVYSTSSLSVVICFCFCYTFKHVLPDYCYSYFLIKTKFVTVKYLFYYLKKLLALKWFGRGNISFWDAVLLS